jgi:hypothetical protein
MMRPSDLRGGTRLAVEATSGVAAIVAAVHERVARVPGVPDTPVHAAVRAVTALVYASIHGVTGLVGAALDVLLARVESTSGLAQGSSPAREAVLAALNGVLGDHLAATGNPLALTMRLRPGGRPLPDGPVRQTLRQGPGESVLVMVHGLCMNDLQWTTPGGHDHGAALGRDLGATVLRLHYNTGLPVSTNGRAFALLLEALLRTWPVPLRHLVILGHSMGGLVARSACHHAELLGHRWPGRLRSLVFLGTPHHGAPLERGGHRVEQLLELTPYTAPFARLGRIRSAGITDLRHGRLPGALPRGVACYAVAGTLRKAPRAGRPPGDGLVPVESALGRHPDRTRALRIPASRRWLAHGTGHLDLLGSPEVYAQLRLWLTGRKDPSSAAARAGRGA